MDLAFFEQTLFDIKYSQYGLALAFDSKDALANKVRLPEPHRRPASGR